jgi:hypothetical protein
MTVVQSAIDDAIDLLGKDDEASLADADLQRILAAAVRCYTARAMERRLDAFPPASGVTATDVMFAATAMLRAADVHLFEFATWQTFSGVRAEHGRERTT